MNQPNPSDIDWWSLQQLATRWGTSLASLRRMAALPEKDPKHLKIMRLGKRQVRIHSSEIFRHEADAKSIPSRQQEIVRKPPSRRVNSLLDRRREALRKARQEGASVAG